MKEKEIKITIRSCDVSELTEDELRLIEEAKKATAHAFSPYSHFSVGAALLLENGKTVIGANQENAAFPSGTCAERSAIFAAQSQFPDSPVRIIAIAAQNSNGFLPEPVTPCGACRQVILGIEDRYGKEIRILLYGTKMTYVIERASDLLPLSFVDSSMSQL